MFRWLREQCAQQHVEVLHNHGMWQMNAVYPAWVTKNTATKLVYSPRGALSEWALKHGSPVKPLFFNFFQKPALLRADCFHATAISEYEEIRRLGFNSPVMILPNGIDLPKVLPTRQSGVERPRTVLFLSRLHKKKGVEILLYAWQKIQDKHQDFNLRICGSDESYHASSGYRLALEQLSRDLRLKRVAFSGAVYSMDKQLVYAESDVLVLPTYSENFGMVVAEALASAVPVIVSKGAPWADVVKEGAGWWVDIGVGPLVGALDHALSLPRQDLAAMGQKGRAWMERDFSWSGIGERMSETYRWLCDKSLSVPEWVRLN